MKAGTWIGCSISALVVLAPPVWAADTRSTYVAVHVVENVNSVDELAAESETYREIWAAAGIENTGPTGDFGLRSGRWSVPYAVGFSRLANLMHRRGYELIEWEREIAVFRQRTDRER